MDMVYDTNLAFSTRRSSVAGRCVDRMDPLWVQEGFWPQISDKASFRAGRGERMCQMSQGRKTDTIQKCSDIKINGNNDAHKGQI